MKMRVEVERETEGELKEKWRRQMESGMEALEGRVKVFFFYILRNMEVIWKKKINSYNKKMKGDLVQSKKGSRRRIQFGGVQWNFYQTGKHDYSNRFSCKKKKKSVLT